MLVLIRQARLYMQQTHRTWHTASRWRSSTCLPQLTGWGVWLWAACWSQWCNWLPAATSLPPVYLLFHCTPLPPILPPGKNPYQSPCCDSPRNYFSFISHFVLIFHPAPLLLLCLAHICSPSLSSSSRVRAVGLSPLCPLNIGRRVVCGWRQRTLFFSPPRGLPHLPLVKRRSYSKYRTFLAALVYSPLIFRVFLFFFFFSSSCSHFNPWMLFTDKCSQFLAVLSFL